MKAFHVSTQLTASVQRQQHPWCLANCWQQCSFIIVLAAVHCGCRISTTLATQADTDHISEPYIGTYIVYECMECYVRCGKKHMYVPAESNIIPQCGTGTCHAVQTQPPQQQQWSCAQHASADHTIMSVNKCIWSAYGQHMVSICIHHNTPAKPNHS
jgi:hypothetical protein